MKQSLCWPTGAGQRRNILGLLGPRTGGAGPRRGCRCPWCRPSRYWGQPGSFRRWMWGASPIRKMKSDLEIFLETDLDLVGWIITVDLLLKPVLAIRNIGVTEEVIKPALDYFTEEGFINYFGTQRFGTTGVTTRHVGKEMISSNLPKLLTSS